MVILGCASAFAKILTIEQIPAMITHSLMTLTENGIIIIIILINILLLIVGCFMDTTPAIIVLSPILLPIAVSISSLNCFRRRLMPRERKPKVFLYFTLKLIFIIYKYTLF